MFEQKQVTLLGKKENKTSVNPFLAATIKESVTTKSANGALKFDGTADEFVNQFGSLGSFKEERSFKDVSKSMSVLWAISPRFTVMFSLFIRMITRVTQLFDGSKTETVQRGAGLKNEGILRMMWINIYHREVFWKNIELFISVGAWKDIIQMLNLDLQYNGWKNRALDWDAFGKLILGGLENPNTSELIKKYLPQIQSGSNLTTLNNQADTAIGKWICSLLYGGKTEDNAYWKYKLYRQMKASGTAHQWQQLISKGQHKLIDFNTIHGRALSQIVSSDYLKNHGLEDSYTKWIESKPIAKFTGYVYELASKIVSANTKYKQDTINKQYEGLLKLAGKVQTRWMVVKDNSGSMDLRAISTGVTAYMVAKSLSIYFANLLEGPFHNHYIDFSNKSTMNRLKGSNFVEYWNNEVRRAHSNTNFISIADLLVDALNSGVREDFFPEGLILLSDGEFDSPQFSEYKSNNKIFSATNLEAFRIRLKRGGFSKSFVDNFKLCFWDIRNNATSTKGAKYETHELEKNVFYMSGFDGAIITFLTGVEGENKEQALPTNAKELFLASMKQEILERVEI